MTSSAAAATPKKAGAWTVDEEKTMLHQMVVQLIGDKKGAIKWTEIKVAGRTTRSIMEHWPKISNDVAAADLANAGPAGTPKVRAPRGSKKDATPTKNGKSHKPTPKKRKMQGSDDEGDVELLDVKDKTPEKDNAEDDDDKEVEEDEEA